MKIVHVLCVLSCVAMCAVVSCSDPSSVQFTTNDETGWIPIGAQSLVGSRPALSTVNDADGVAIDFDMSGFFRKPLELEGEDFIQLSVPKLGRHAAVGDPALPFKGTLIEIPYGVQPQVELERSDQVSLGIGYRIAPRQPPQIESVDTPPPFTMNQDTYSTDAFLPARPVEIGQIGFLRGRRLAFVKVFPFQYNPVTTELRAYRSMRIRVSFRGQPDVSGEGRKQQLHSPAFENLARRMISNYRPSRSYAGVRAPGSGADYLIIASDQYYDCVQELADWKVRKGYQVHVAKTSETGTGTDEIKAYVQQAYDTWQPAPTYLLLVGDHGDLPGYPVSPDAYGSPFISDLPYSLTDGTDYWADITTGRLSVDSAAACQTVVGKILQYDRDPDSGSWYEHSLVAAYFQDSSDCVADRWFLETAVHVYDYLRDQLGHSMHTSLVTGNQCTTYNYRADSYPHRPENNGVVPDYIASNFLSPSAATQAISGAINGGVGLVQHRDHGGETLWGDPPYTVSDINGLSNSSMTPIVLSINCLTGHFDYSSGDCFAEAFQKKAGGGAVGVVAATRVSYSGWNDLLTHGLFTSFFPDYDDTHTTNDYPNSFRVAQSLNFAKHYMYTYQGDGDETLYEFRLFHWFGDPEMEYRPGTPQHLTGLIHSSALPPGSASFQVSGAPDGALVGLSQDGLALGRAVSAGSVANVPISGTIQPAVPVTLTVTHHSAVPYEYELVTVSDQGILTFDRETYDCEHVAGITLADLGLAGQVSYQLTVQPMGQDVTLSESPAGSGVFTGSLALSGLVSHGDTLSASYQDEDDGSGSGQVVTAQAGINCLPPQISGVSVANLTYHSADVCFDTDVPTTALVDWGETLPLSNQAEDASWSTSHCLGLDNLSQCTSYYYQVSATDELGHVAVDDQGGNYYSFTTAHSGLQVIYTENLDSDPGWTTTGDWEFGAPQGLGGSNPDPTSGYTGSNVYGNDLSEDGKYPDNASDYHLTSPSIDLSGAVAPMTLSFYRWLNIESSSYDKARVEGFDGSSWVTIWEHSGSTTTTAGWTRVEYDISQFAGNSDFRLRWTLDTDGSVTYSGWNIDDIQIIGTDPNASCGNQPPNADAGADQQVAGGALVILDGTGSSDPDGDPISYAWNQTAGPSVTLSDPASPQPTFSAPQVTVDTTLRFSLVVSDGQSNSQPDSVNVVVVAENLPPDADAGADQAVSEGDAVQLDGSSSSDPNGDILTYQWSQTSGPAVQLSDPASATPGFTAPDVDTTTQLSFSLTVSDGSLSDSDSVTVTVADSGSGGQASYDGTLRAPVCGQLASSCDSGGLLNGRAGLGPEPNAPNTLYSSCADGTSGSYHEDESIDHIRVATTSGANFASGQQVSVEVTVWAWDDGSEDHLDLYFTADASANPPEWTLIGTYEPGGGGARTVSASYTIPPGGSLQAVRANFRYNGSASTCTSGNYNDHDDLVFAVDAGGSNPGQASYNGTLKAPTCAQPGSLCDSGSLLDGRADKGPEPNTPNTLYDSCADGTSGSYHSDESIDRIRVFTSSGNFTVGSQVTVEVSVWAWSSGSSDHLDLYYTADASANPPAWTYIGTFEPGGGGARTITANYTLPSGGSLQAVRANFRYNGSASDCSSGNYNDHDDLVFAVE